MARTHVDGIKIVAAVIADQIAKDISDRAGIGNELDMIDDDVRKEMVDTWADIAETVLLGVMDMGEGDE